MANNRGMRIPGERIQIPTISPWVRAHLLHLRKNYEIGAAGAK